MGACESVEQLPTTPPAFYYFPIAGRGEITRMIANLGGLQIDDKFTDGKDLDLASFGSAGGMPVFEHGDMKLSQENAILSYIYKIAPKLKTLSAAHTAKDRQFIAIMDDIMDGCMPKVFAQDPKAGENCKVVVEKFYGILEGLAPAAGFVNGLPYPTGADFVVVILKEGYMPYNVVTKLGGVDPWATSPKLKALYERVIAVPEVKGYVDNSKSMKGNPFNM